MKATERFLKYIQVDTTSDESSETCPSTPNQKVLARQLADELAAMGVADARMDEDGYVYGSVPATDETMPAIGLIAHVDTSDAVPGGPIHVRRVRYEGGDIVLNAEKNVVLRAADFPALENEIGHTLLVTDGTTLLGADDKAGVAEIMTACEHIIAENRPHGRISVCFTPDEEVGHGAALLDLERFGADFAYTMDGGVLNEVNFETFNAASAHWEINGFNIHPGDAKNTMINACLVAMEINSMLPSGDTPAKTEGYEGFFHLMEMSGTVEAAALDYIVRDHDAAAFAVRKETMRHIEKLINEKYGAGTAKLTLADQYRNMAECLSAHMEVVELAEKAIRKAGLEPVRVPIRGGTDGAQLSFRGLPCPNLGTGGYSFHGPFEHITVEGMDVAVDIILNLISESIA